MSTKSQNDLSKFIFDTLKSDLINLNIKPGETIVEADVCDRFSVTRPPVRTAFRRLSDLGLVEIVPYKGVKATLISLDRINQIIHMRTILESQIICDFIDSNPDVFVLEELEHIVRLQKLLVEQGNVDRNKFYELDDKLHSLWFNKINCNYIWDSIKKHQIEYNRFIMLDFFVTLKYSDIVKDHIILKNAIFDKEKDKIEPIIGTHLNNGLRRMGNSIFDEYQQYFQLSNHIQYWRDYNKKYYVKRKELKI